MIMSSLVSFQLYMTVYAKYFSVLCSDDLLVELDNTKKINKRAVEK